MPFLTGCHHDAITPRTTTHRALAPIMLGADSLPLKMSRERLAESVVECLHKRIMGRFVSLRETARVAVEIRPIVENAVKQPGVQPLLRRMAQDTHTSLDEVKARWTDLQEADLLLEAGGDPEAVSPSMAAGAAQWLAGTAAGQGLYVNSKVSDPLTAQIEELDRQIAWLDYLQRPDADPNAPGAPVIAKPDAQTQLPQRLKTRALLCARRRQVDARFDPRQAIYAQTRYLLKLYPRYPCPDWLFQAYHGGEGGVQRLLRDYVRTRGRGPVTELIRHGLHGSLLSYEQVYLTTTPRSHAAAFSYLYGRSDDHRHYWWKLRASEHALAIYRHDPKEFEHEWESLLPGRRTEALWYPNGPNAALQDLDAVRAARADGTLIPILSCRDFSVRTTPLDRLNANWYAALRPAAKGALLLVAAAYRQCGGREPLTLGDMILTPAMAAREAAIRPPLPLKTLPWPPDLNVNATPGGGPPAAFNYHTTGLVFDLLRPHDPMQRKILEYALGYFEDREILAVTDAKDGPERRYHICPNPRFGQALARIGLSGKTPELPNI